ncbi:acyltransferase family protein [Bradyrhizobium liaoningense]|uniref:acyltransferase family protein n=1 Tax=Bradyrhizobium liaoningense TaxID=43992 RepID=UPI001BACC85F|nr:acyltransferase [Bradyrhizobium liaoningense]MBR0987621.1 acyltransferase [Bradyrhizobium liaoningense]
MSAKQISPSAVSALNFGRAVAALYVVLHHVAHHHGWSSQGFGLLLRFGQESVLVFFLLSGFVIFANERDRAWPPYSYYLRRARRIYPALIAAVLISTIVAADNGTLTRDFHASELIGTLFGLQDISSLKPGVIVDPYLGNDPLWSLSYELAFYLVFPFVLRLWKNSPHLMEHGLGAVCCLAYIAYALIPNHWSLVGAYFLVWWCGAAVAERYQKGERSFRALGAPLYWLTALCSISALITIWVGSRGAGYYPVLPLRHFAVALGLIILLFNSAGSKAVRLLAPASAAWAAIASISYGLYVLHYPLLVTWQRAQSVGGFLVALMLLFVCAYFVDFKILKFLSTGAAQPRSPKQYASGTQRPT